MIKNALEAAKHKGSACALFRAQLEHRRAQVNFLTQKSGFAKLNIPSWQADVRFLTASKIYLT